MTPPPIRAVLFDKDGTLIDYRATWLPINRRVADTLSAGRPALAAALLRAGGHDPDTDEVAPGCVLAAGSAEEVAAQWAPMLGRPVSVLTSKIDRLFQESVAGAVPVCDLPALLGALRAQGLKLGIATSDSHAAAVGTVKHLRVTSCFDFIVGYDSGVGTKPGPGMVHAFCEAVACRPEEVAVVGDNVHDLLMGRAAGAGLVVGVLTGSSGAADLAPLADHVLPDITGMAALLSTGG